MNLKCLQKLQESFT